jgi:hypothetical protein
MAIIEGDRFTDRSTGQVYRVRRTEHGTVILEAEDTPNRVWMGDEILELFFEKVKN